MDSTRLHLNMREALMRLSHLMIALVVSCAIFATAALAEPGLLDGKVFVGEAGVKGKRADELRDVITFGDGKFHSSSCDQWGYGKGAYRASEQGDTITFESETLSEKDGKLVWKGALKGDTLEGSFVHYRKPTWYRPKPEPIEHWFKAKLKQG